MAPVRKSLSYNNKLNNVYPLSINYVSLFTYFLYYLRNGMDRPFANFGSHQLLVHVLHYKIHETTEHTAETVFDPISVPSSVPELYALTLNQL